MKCLVVFPLHLLYVDDTLFCSILSFGAPMPNKYKIIVEGRDPILFETEAVSLFYFVDYVYFYFKNRL